MRQLYTRWGRELQERKKDPQFAEDAVLCDYPRPQLVRGNWTCLNGYWEYALTKNPGVHDTMPDSDAIPDDDSYGQNEKHTMPEKREATVPELSGQDPLAMLQQCPTQWDGRILVPFSPESVLSEVNRQLQPQEFLWYHRTFSLGKIWSTAGRQVQPAFGQTGMGNHRQRLLLHFGAVDQTCMVYVNHQIAAIHIGGYLSFTADITDLVRDGTNDLLVLVQDLSDTSYHARGKQQLHRGGMFYTATSGIWQSVWMEQVPAHYIDHLEMDADSDKEEVRFRVVTRGGRREDNAIIPVTIAVRAAARHDKDPMYDPAEYEKTEAYANSQPVACDGKTGVPGTKAGEAVPFRKGEDIQGNADRKTNKAETNRGEIIAAASGFADEPLTIRIPKSQVHHWSVEEPWLYDVDVILENTDIPDHVTSYFALRAFSLEKDDRGIWRACLNHEPYFQKGVLDQGYWPDGLLTPPSDKAMIFDIDQARRTGFTMIRKHIKVEPDRWYYHCDRRGMIVWQDMVNGGEALKQWFVTYLATGISLLQLSVPDSWHHLLSRENEAGREEFETDLAGEIAQLKNHPCIGTWVIFNEGWGQFDTNRLTQLTRHLDPRRLIDQASGWFDQRGGDFRSVHNYFFPYRVHRDRKRAYVLSEFGGKTLRIEDHCAQEIQDGQYGYGTMQDTAALNQAYREMDAKVMALEEGGLCGTVYTQWTDIEDEINGVYTYDREVRKIDPLVQRVNDA